MWVFCAFREIQRRQGRASPTTVYENFGIIKRLGKFCVQLRSVRPFAISREVYEGNDVVPASTVASSTASAWDEIFPSSKL